VILVSSGKDASTGVIATFNVDHKSGKELRQYLSNVADQCEASASDLPDVIILDNLLHVASLGEAFNPFLGVKFQLWSVISFLLLFCFSLVRLLPLRYLAISFPCILFYFILLSLHLIHLNLLACFYHISFYPHCTYLIQFKYNTIQ